MNIKYIIGGVVVLIGVLFFFNAQNTAKIGGFNGSGGEEVVASETLAEPFTAITEADFNAHLKDTDVVVIDLRTPEEVAQGKITKDALEIDFYGETFKDELAKLDKDATYFTYCASGNRSGTTREIMKELGFTKVYDLKGGINAWKGDIVGQTERAKAVQQFLGKPTVVFIAGTFCPYCQNALPGYETEIWDVYKEKANIFVNVIDKKKFPQKRIAQGFDAQLTFQTLAGEACEFVPSWVLLDADGALVDASCGSKKGNDVIIEGLETLLQ